jgi:hypothetical protein
MKSVIDFLNTHLWIGITVVGVTILLIQHRHGNELRREIVNSERYGITSSTRSQSRVISASPPTILELLPLSHREPSGSNFLPGSDLSIALGNATADDLIHLLEELESEPTDDPEAEALKGFLSFHLAALDPRKALNRIQSPGKPSGLFRALATKSPESAQQWLDSADLGDLRDHFENSLNCSRFLSDPTVNISDWEKIRFDQDHASVSFGPSPKKELPILPPESLPKLASLIHKPEHSSKKAELITTLMTSAALDSIESAKTYAESLDLSPVDLIDTFKKLQAHGLGSADLLDWALSAPEALDEIKFNVVESFIANFAQRNLSDAADWLNQVETSPENKDLLIHRYSQVLAYDDPRAALEWTARITDPKLLERTKREVIHTWKDREQEAAEAWEAGE